jgi:hypothetical protein
MAPNLYTFNPFSGVTTGIQMTTDALSPRGQTLPDHIMVGNRGFIQLEKNWRHPSYARGTRLFEASLALISAASGTEFEVLAPRNQYSNKLYCFVDPAMPAGTRLRANPEEVNAWIYQVATDGVRIVMFDKFVGAYLVEFEADGDEIDIWFQNGYIARLLRQGDVIVSADLSASEIAGERVYQMQDQIDSLKLSEEIGMRRCHGIIGGATRLLAVTRDRSAQDVYVDFLSGYLKHMTDRLRSEVRQVLLQLKHPYAGNFADGWAGNVVAMPERGDDAQAGAQKLAAAKARKAKKAAEDRALREKMRGGFGSSKKQR